MKIDFDHWKGAQIGEDISSFIALEKKLSIIKALNPKFSKDGNQWCYLYGELPNDCIVGFGNTPNEAMNNFVDNFYSQKAIVVNHTKTPNKCKQN